MKNPPRRHISLDRLESFIAAAECGGITAAARRLGRSQPTVSQHLQRLETQLDRQLVTRGPGGLTLTAEGRRLLPLARGLLSLDRQFAASDDQAPPLRLGACSNIGIYLLPDLLMDLRRQGQPMPRVAIASNPEIARQLADGEVDVALMEWWDDQAGFTSQIWRREPVVAILPLDHPLAPRKTVTLAALRREKLLGGEGGTGTGRLLRTYLRVGKPLDVAMNLGSTEAVKRAVAAGLGVSLVLQLSVAEHLAGPARVLAVRPLMPALQKPLHLIWRTGVAADRGLLAYLLSTAAVQ
jgi:DNA-binding transcriptional LysR family regulator